MTMNKIVYPYIPNSTKGSKEEMMATLGIKDEMELYKDIPEKLKFHGEMQLPEPLLDEFSINKHMQGLFSKNACTKNYAYFIGAGCPNHYTPAVCDEIVSRGEFLTAYGGCSMADKGKWQTIWEYQAQMSELLDVDFIGFPQYDGSWALAHVMRMTARITNRNQIIVPKSMNPMLLQVAKNYMDGVVKKVVEIVEVDYDKATGLLDLEDLKVKLGPNTASIIIENPSFLGVIESQAEEIGKMAKANGSEFVVYADPISLGVMEAPVNYGADITVGDIHSLGLHMGAGGCHGGYVAFNSEAKYTSNYKDLAVSIYPDIEEKLSYIWWNFEEGSYGQRDEANEFTGTASNLWAIGAGVYLSLMGPQGMKEIGITNMKRAQYAANELSQIAGVNLMFSTPFFNEFVVNFDKTGKTVAAINKALVGEQIFGGYDLSAAFPELGQSALYCVTEVNTKEEIDNLVAALKKILG